MVVQNTEDGFTIVEMVVTLVVMTLFVTLLFQTYLADIAQQTHILQQASANDIAITNLKKIVARTSPLLSSITCDPSSSSQNNLTTNASASGSIIATNAAGGTPQWTATQATAEPITGTRLPSSTTQTLTAFFPEGCGLTMPVEIVSTVNYGSDSATHATYVD